MFFCPAFSPLYQWWKWMIIAAESGLGLLPLAQSSQAITQPKFTYPKNLTRHLEPNPSSSQFHSLPQTSIITFLFGSSFQRPSRWEETAKGGVWFSPTQLPITFISHSKKSTDDQRFTSSWSRGGNLYLTCSVERRGVKVEIILPPTSVCLWARCINTRDHERARGSPCRASDICKLRSENLCWIINKGCRQ